VRLRYGDLETFVQRFAPNVTRGGIFLGTRTPRAPGTVFAFEVLLSTGQIALAGEGKVIWVKEFDPAAPQRPHGMGVQFTHIDPATRETLNRILRSKGSDGGAGRARNGTGPVAVAVDTSVDLAAEYGLDETALRRAVDHRWMVTTADSELDDLVKPEPAEAPVTLEQALAELPRLLNPTAAGRRRSGAYRSLETTNTQIGEPDRAQTEKSRPVIDEISGGNGHDPKG
jgi:uncharacterized protein (TIGR02266 family)